MYSNPRPAPTWPCRSVGRASVNRCSGVRDFFSFCGHSRSGRITWDICTYSSLPYLNNWIRYECLAAKPYLWPPNLFLNQCITYNLLYWPNRHRDKQIVRSFASVFTILRRYLILIFSTLKCRTIRKVYPFLQNTCFFTKTQPFQVSLDERQ